MRRERGEHSSLRFYALSSQPTYPGVVNPASGATCEPQTSDVHRCGPQLWVFPWLSYLKSRWPKQTVVSLEAPTSRVQILEPATVVPADSDLLAKSLAHNALIGDLALASLANSPRRQMSEVAPRASLVMRLAALLH